MAPNVKLSKRIRNPVAELGREYLAILQARAQAQVRWDAAYDHR
jgi:hypothetical protein